MVINSLITFVSHLAFTLKYASWWCVGVLQETKKEIKKERNNMFMEGFEGYLYVTSTVHRYRIEDEC